MFEEFDVALDSARQQMLLKVSPDGSRPPPPVVLHPSSSNNPARAFMTSWTRPCQQLEPEPFLRDFDKNRQGRVTGVQFRQALDMAHFQFTDREVRDWDCATWLGAVAPKGLRASLPSFHPDMCGMQHQLFATYYQDGDRVAYTGFLEDLRPSAQLTDLAAQTTQRVRQVRLLGRRYRDAGGVGQLMRVCVRWCYS
jgi:hypothetical protein